MKMKNTYIAPEIFSVVLTDSVSRIVCTSLDAGTNLDGYSREAYPIYFDLDSD